MTREKYTTYQKTGVSWLGDIPEHWEIRRIKYVFKEMEGRSKYGDEDLLSVSQYTGVTKKADKISEGESITNAKTLEGYKIVEKGDLVINIMLAWNGSLGISPFNGITSPAYSVYRLIEGNEKYFGYLFKTPNAKQEFKKQSTGIIDSRLRMYTDSFFNIKTALPPHKEQIAIANFLDYKLEKIFCFINKKNQLIKLIEERKAATIDKAVTKGVKPGVKFKDSGIEWLGEIPSKWAVEKGYSLFDLKNDTINVEEIQKQKVIHYSIPNIQEYETGQLEDGNSIDSNKFILNGGELLYSKLNPRKGTVVISKSHLETAIASSEFVVLAPKNCNIIFYYFFLKSFTFKQAISSQVRSATKSHERVKPNVIIKSHFPCPNRQEQDEIVSFLKAELEGFSKVKRTIEKEITLVEEYKTALIAEAVTGKIDVRDFKVPTTEEPLEMVAEEASNFNKAD